MTPVPVEEHLYDAVIVGAGAAGLRAAIETAGRYATVVLTKLHPTRSDTGIEREGVAAALANVGHDRWEWHAFDTVRAGDDLTDQPAVDVMCQEASAAVLELEHMGVPFDRLPDGRLDQRRARGHTRDHGESPAPRAVQVEDRTGLQVLHALHQQCLARGVRFCEEFVVVDVLFDGDPRQGGRTAGVVAYEVGTGALHLFHTKAVFFATGGAGRVFRRTSGGHAATGDGPAVLFRRGVPLQDMEFVQFQPTGLTGSGILVGEVARLAGATLRNGDGTAFMEGYAPVAKELAPPDVVCRAMVAEIAAGRGCGPEKDSILLDLTHLPDDVVERQIPGAVELCMTHKGVDLRRDPIAVQPTAHASLGGVPTDVRGRVVIDGSGTTVPGLYAAGECACVSVHGADRLAANGLLDAIVFGRRGGAHMAAYAAEHGFPPLPSDPLGDARAMLEWLKGGYGTEKVGDLRDELQSLMSAEAGVLRHETGLSSARGRLAALRQRYAQVHIDDVGDVWNTDFVEAVELGFLLDAAEAIVESARARTESRGAHHRTDHPTRDDDRWLHHTLAYLEPDGGIRLAERPVERGSYPREPRTY